MPIYEYQCQSCQKVFEYMQRMSDDPMTECEECKGSLERIISQSAFHLKGGGWYKDLYSSTKKDDGTAGSSESSSTGSSKAATSSNSESTASTSDAGSSSSTSSESTTSSTPAASKSTSAGSKD